MDSNEELKIPTMWKIQQAADLTGLSYDHVRRLVLTKQVRSIRVGEKGTRVLIDAKSLIDWMNGE